MSELLKILVPSLLALAGAIFTAWLGYRQWRIKYDRSRSEDFIRDQRAAYLKLWEQVKEIDIALRANVNDTAGPQQSLRELNAYLLKEAIYIDEVDRRRTADYVQALVALRDLLRSNERYQDISKEMEDSRMLPLINLHVLEGAELHSDDFELQRLVDEAIEHEKYFVSRWREVLESK